MNYVILGNYLNPIGTASLIEVSKDIIIILDDKLGYRFLNKNNCKVLIETEK